MEIAKQIDQTRRSGCSSRGSLCRICNPTHINIMICNLFCCQNIILDTIQLWNFITRRDRPTSPRDRRRIEEPLHTL